MAQAKARLSGGAERPRNRPVRPAPPDYAAVLRGAQARDGAEVRDADGHALLDVVNDQGAVLLGWNDREVEAAVRAGRDPARLETEAAARLAALIPSAEAVGFRSAEVEARLVGAGAEGWLQIGGDPAWSVVSARPRPGGDAAALEAALAADLYEHGVLSLGAHIPSLACGEREVGRLLAAYDAVLPGLALRAHGGAFERRAERRA